MREFWDARARENALYFVDNTLDYRTPDTDRFWRQGHDALDRKGDGTSLAGVEDASADACLSHVVRGEGTQFCLVLLRKRPR
jgi:hypothetical protein